MTARRQEQLIKINRSRAASFFAGGRGQLPRILLVEDDADVRVLMEHVLIGDRYEVDPAATVAAADALLQRRHYDLVLADGVLPDGTGMEIARQAQRSG